jgi:PAS domain S-box-containing protein/putative nucleotidyltransferase with HDIG domain
MKLIYKLLLGFLVIILLYGIAGYISIRTSRDALQKSIEESSSILAQEVIDHIDRAIHSKIEIFQEYSESSLTLQKIISESNRKFETIDNIDDYINTQNREWKSIPEHETTPLVRELMNNSLSGELRRKIEFYKENGNRRVFREILVTNKYGVNIAMTDRVEDYRQDDKQWWQVAKKNGISVGNIRYDEATGAYYIDIGIKVNDKKGNFIGMMKVVLNIREIFSIIDKLKLKGKHAQHKTMHFKLATEDGRLIYSTTDFVSFEDISKELAPPHGPKEADHVDHLIDERNKKLFTYAYSKGFRDFKGLKWILIIEHNTEEIFAPVAKLKNNILIVSLTVTILALLMAFFTSISVAKPLKRLKDAAGEIGRGNLDISIDIKSTDEIGQLADSFNRMIENLKKAKSELIEANASLKESEEKFKAIFDYANDGILVVNVENKRFHIANQMICKMLGYSQEELKNMEIRDIHPEENISYVLNQYERFVKGDSSVAEDIPVKRKDGSIFYADISSTPITVEGKTYLAGIFRDITERKKAEEKIKQQNEFMENVLESLTHPFYVLGVDDYTVKLANSAAKIGGLSEGITCYKLTHNQKHPCDGKEHECPLEMIKKTKKPVTVEHIHPDKHGNPRYYEVHGYPIFDGNGNVTQMIEYTLDITDRKKAEEQLQRQIDRLSALRSIDKAITSSFDLSLTSDVLLNQVVTQLGVDAATILRLNPHTNILEYIAGKGFRTRALKYTRLKLGESNAGRAAIERRTVVIHNLKEDINGFKRSETFPEEGFVSYVGVPLIAKEQVKGVMELFHRSLLKIEPEWMDFVETIAGQAAIVIDNATLFEDLQHSNIELVLAYDSTIEGWSRALDMRDKGTEGHSQRVTEMTLRIARELGIKDEELVHIRRGALLHDIGKMGIPDSILLKNGQLTDEEWEIMKRHPQYAYDMLKNIEYLRPALDIPYCHHERWNGTGYPRGLKGEEIPLAARIFAVVDVWDALTSERPYRPAWSKEKTREYIRSLAGIYFDPKVVEVFLKMNLESSS